MGHQKTTDALEAVRLVRRAADGDGLAWDRLVDQYQELVAAMHGIKMANDDQPLRETARHGPQTDALLRAAERAQTVGDALSSLPLPLRWQQLFQLLLADPPGQHPRQQGK